MSTSAAKIIKQLIAKEGPMTNQNLYNFISQHPEELVSKSYLKKKVLQTLEGQGVLFKKVNHQATKPTWEWQFRKAEDIEKYKNI
ncbi:hypothetical protein G6F56_011688 [Rhizopus delemar]|nr:hypothetical protein G6F56_011688 [Rhizopus delemar]